MPGGEGGGREVKMMPWWRDGVAAESSVGGRCVGTGCFVPEGWGQLPQWCLWDGWC